MRILLPPSEAKQPGGRGKSLASRVPLPRWQQAREPVLAALVALCQHPEAASALLLPPGVADVALAQNRVVLTSPTLPALERYSGVLYEGLNYRCLSLDEMRMAKASVLIFSGLFGVLRGADPVPAYRVPAKATLPGLGVAGTYWRSILPSLLPELLDSGPIIDLRSTDYRAMWAPRPGSAPAGYLAVRILSRRRDGSATVISYDSKLGKGRLAAALINSAASGRKVTGVQDVVTAWQSIGGTDAVLSARGDSLDLIR